MKTDIIDARNFGLLSYTCGSCGQQIKSRVRQRNHTKTCRGTGKWRKGSDGSRLAKQQEKK